MTGLWVSVLRVRFWVEIFGVVVRKPHILGAPLFGHPCWVGLNDNKDQLGGFQFSNYKPTLFLPRQTRIAQGTETEKTVERVGTDWNA